MRRSETESSADGDATSTSDDLCWVSRLLPSQGAFASLTTRFKGFSGPVGSGKSAALCFEIIRQAHLNVGRQGLLAAPTFGMLRDATLAALLGFLHEHEVQYECRKSDGELSIVATGSLILLRSLDEPERLRGTNLAWFAIDELSYSREEGWLRLEARLRDPRAESLCGFAVWTPQGHDWIYKRFVHKPIEGYGVVRAKPFENKHLLTQTPDYYERLELSYDPRFYQQEALGEYINSRADRVYHCFNAAVHVVAHKYDPRQKLMWALDFNVAPMSSVLVQEFNGRLAVIDEIVIDRATTDDACAEFLNRYGGHIGPVEIFGDASGRSMHTTGVNDYTMLTNHLTRRNLRSAKLRVPSINPPVMNRVQRVNGMLMSAIGEVRLEIDPRCKELIKDFEEVLYKPETGVVDKTRDLRRTHAADALGYLVWELYGDRYTVGEKRQRLF